MCIKDPVMTVIFLKLYAPILYSHDMHGYYNFTESQVTWGDDEPCSI